MPPSRNLPFKTTPTATAIEQTLSQGVASAPDNPYNSRMWRRWFAEKERAKTFQKYSFLQQVAQARRAIEAQAFVVENRAVLISELNARLGARLDGLLMLRGDRYANESLAQNAERLRFFSGFSGSYGWAIFDFRAKKKSIIASDSRYRLQLRTECDSRLFEFIEAPLQQIADTIANMFPSTSIIGYDPWQVSQNMLEETQERLTARTTMIKLVPISAQKIDTKIESLWRTQPPQPISLLSLRQAHETGETPTQRIQRIQEQLQTSDRSTTSGANGESLLLTASDACAWGLSLRASDVPFLPVALGFALLNFDRQRKAQPHARFFTSTRPALLGENLSHCEILPSAALAAALRESAKQKRVLVLDKNSTPSALVGTCRRAGINLRFTAEPTETLRLCKTRRERTNMRKAHLWDGIALVRFFAWLEQVAASNRRLDEYEAAQKLYDFRLQGGKLLDESFKTISASDANAAQIHYPTPRKGAKLLQRGKPYLIDSGGQYTMGTTDITRTLIFGKGTGSTAFRNAYTAVLRGHIALATAIFPEGTRASTLDAFARRPLWQQGLDYPHATGHGVGFCLGVHEGGVRLAQSGGSETLKVGMILSNEPGFYSPRHFGIRTENLMEVVRARGVNSEKKRNLCFHTLSLAPIARAPIIIELMEGWEQRWLDAYHAGLRETIAPHLQEAHERAFLKQATEPLAAH